MGDFTSTDEVAQVILDRERREATIAVKVDAVDVRVFDPLERLLHQAVAEDVQRLEIDLESVSFADSSVVRLALKAQEALAPKGARVVIKAPPRVLRLFEVTQTAHLFEIVPLD